jgi:ribonuclease P protein component
MKEPFGTPIKPAAGAELGFPRSARILRPAEFRTTYDEGLRIPGPLFAAFCKARPGYEMGCQAESKPSGASKTSGPRLGITVPRAIGGAVDRNRIKRRLREVFRLHRAALGTQWDIVLNPRRAALTASFPELERAFGRVIEKCGP